METPTLPPRRDTRPAAPLPDNQQITIVGAAGAGKSRFMRTLARSFGDRAFTVSALGTVSCEKGGSVEALYNASMPPKTLAPEGQPATDLDRLAALLFWDEFRYLLQVKSTCLLEGKEFKAEPTRLDSLVRVWQEIFPDNTVMRAEGRLLFSTPGGTDPISTSKLSASEKSVLYYVAAALYAPKDGVIFIDAPAMFLHPAMLHIVWNAVEGLRPDCTFVYNTGDVEFMNSRTENAVIWVRSHDAEAGTWDYEVLTPGSLPEDLNATLLGTRRPVLFIEGDATHSIDAKLYPLVFPSYTVRPLGSCNKVIEATRSFVDMKQIHQLDSRGIVDRDRRTPHEVEYLRRKSVMVPEVAEVENFFLLEDVISVMALRQGRDPQKVLRKVRAAVLKMFATHFREQVLQHVRHRMKRQLETRGDVKVRSIGELEKHLRSLPNIINVREQYNTLMAEFQTLSDTGDYAGILRVFNHKPMLPESRVAQLLGFKDTSDYIAGVLTALKSTGSTHARLLRRAIRAQFRLPD